MHTAGNSVQQVHSSNWRTYALLSPTDMAYASGVSNATSFVGGKPAAHRSALSDLYTKGKPRTTCYASTNPSIAGSRQQMIQHLQHLLRVPFPALLRLYEIKVAVLLYPTKLHVRCG